MENHNGICLMDNTLRALLAELYSVSLELDRLRKQMQQLQADCTDLKNQLETKDAVVDLVQRP